jgi:hypothetical protein
MMLFRFDNNFHIHNSNIIYYFAEHIEGRKEPVGACTAHVRVCGGGVGIFLRIRECRIVLLAQGPRIEDEEGRSKGCFQVRDRPYHTCQKFKNIHRAIYIPNFALLRHFENCQFGNIESPHGTFEPMHGIEKSV